MDSDIESSNFADFTGIEEKMDIDKTQHFIPYNWNGIEVFSMSLLTKENRAISMTGMSHSRLLQDVARNTEWSDLDYLVLDMPSGASNIFRDTIQIYHDNIVGGIIVMQPFITSDAKRVIKLHFNFEVPVIGLMENMSYFKCPECNKKYRIFGKLRGKEIADEYDIPYLGDIPLSMKVLEGVKNGDPIMDFKPAISTFDKTVKTIESMETVSLFGKIKQKVSGSIKKKAERIVASLIKNANKIVNIGDLQQKYNFTDQKPFDFVLLSDDRQKVVSRTHMKVKEGKLLVSTKESFEPEFEIDLDFQTLARMVCEKKKTRSGRVLDYDLMDAWMLGDAKVYGKDASPRFVKMVRDLFNEKTVNNLQEQFGGLLQNFI